jgi:hypothetical protein
MLRYQRRSAERVLTGGAFREFPQCLESLEPRPRPCQRSAVPVADLCGLIQGWWISRSEQCRSCICSIYGSLNIAYLEWRQKKSGDSNRGLRCPSKVGGLMEAAKSFQRTRELKNILKVSVRSVRNNGVSARPRSSAWLPVLV